MRKSKRWKRRNRVKNVDLYNAFKELETTANPYAYKIVKNQTFGLVLQRINDAWYTLIYDYKRSRRN